MTDPLLLISKHFYGTLTEDEAANLNAWLRGDAAHARQFVRESIVHRTLRAEWVGTERYRQFLSKQPAEDEQQTESDDFQTAGDCAARPRISRGDPPRGLQVWTSRRRALAVMATALCLVALVTWRLPQVKDRNLPWAAARTDVQLRDAINAVWEPAQAVPGVGPLSLESLTLKTGTISLAFGGGAEAVVEGPATFQPMSATQLRLTTGRVVISCPTPESRGFELLLPGTRIVDLGTEFGVVAGANGAELHVFEGGVALRQDTKIPSDAKIYRRQEACRLSYSSGRIETIPVDGVSFMRPFDVQLRRAQGPWAQYARRLRADRTLVFWSEMTPGPSGQLANVAPPSGDGVQALPGASAPRTAPGRRGPSTALEVVDVKDAVRLRIPGSFENLTLAAWLKFLPEPRPAREHRGILMSDGWGVPGQVHWQRKARDFRLTFPRSDATDHARYVADTTQLDDGEWHLLVTVVDGERLRRVTQYLDGRVIASEPLNVPFRAMQLGTCTLGGWQPPPGSLENRSLNGLIDELFVWKRALDSREVESLYRASL